MKCNVLIFSVLLLFLTKHAKAELQEDTMDTWKTTINLYSPSFGYSSSGILKSHNGFSSYAYNRNKTLLVTAPSGYSIMVAIRYIDLRPKNQDSLTLSSTTGITVLKRYSNGLSYQNKVYYPNEGETYYLSSGDLAVTFTTGSVFPLTSGYDGFELVYTVQGKWTYCNSGNYYCDNGRCIASILTCDGHNHCGDQSSERNCFVPSRPGRTIGIVAGSFFLLIAAVCGIYYVCRRRRFALQSETIVTSHPPPPTNLPSYPPAYPYPSTQYPPPPPAYSAGITNPTYH